MSRFVINVSKNGDRFFSTSRASIGTDAVKAAAILISMQVAFPEAAGYSVECYFIETTAKATRQQIAFNGADDYCTEALALSGTFVSCDE